MNVVFALAGVVLKEMYRRKDFYVLFVLTAVLTLVLGSINFFHDVTVVRFVKGICLLLIWISSLVIAIGAAARQLPAERENRTIFPLLAKPVTRGQVVLGKFLGCWLACGLALLVFYFFFGLVSGSKDGHWPWLQYGGALALHWTMVGIVIALALLGSVLFSSPSANATICFVVVGGILLLARYLNRLAAREPEPLNSLLSALYYLVPHLEWYDVRDLLVNDFPLPGLLYLGAAWLYGMVYATVLLFGTWLAFRRKPLNT